MPLSPNTDRLGNVRILSPRFCSAFLTLCWSDVTVLSRVSQAETRLDVLEAQMQDTSTARSVCGTDSPAATSPPAFHTASAQQMIHSWPRVRLSLASYGNPLSFLANADGSDPSFTKQGRDADHLDLSQARSAIGRLHEHQSDMPLLLLLILESHDWFPSDRVHLQTLSGDSSDVSPDNLTLPSIMGLCLALVSQGLPELPDQHAVIECYFQSILQRQWMMWVAVHERVAVSIAVAYCLLYYWARPLHALGALQSVSVTLKRTSLRLKQDPQLAKLATLYHIIER